MRKTYDRNWISDRCHCSWRRTSGNLLRKVALTRFLSFCRTSLSCSIERLFSPTSLLYRWFKYLYSYETFLHTTQISWVLILGKHTYFGWIGTVDLLDNDRWDWGRKVSAPVYMAQGFGLLLMISWSVKDGLKITEIPII